MGRIKIGDRRVYTLAYADDIVLLLEEEEEIRSLIERLENYSMFDKSVYGKTFS